MEPATRSKDGGLRGTTIPRQLSAIRDLGGGHFDFLAGVLFNEDYTVMRPALIPHAVAIKHATFVERTNSHRFLLHDDIWSAHGVSDITAELRAVNF
jgi:hypothetical protein